MRPTPAPRCREVEWGAASTRREHAWKGDDDLTQAEALATQLLPLLRQSSTRAPRRDAWRAARDRYWTLAVQHHAWMQRIAGAVWGVALTKHVPPLQSRRVVRKAKAPAAPPAPPAP